MSEYYITGVELFWDSEDVKTYHKCGSPKHLVAACEERETAENYKEHRQQFSNIYSKYRVPNHKSFNTKKSDNNINQLRTTNLQGNKPVSSQSSTSDLQQMMKNLLKELTKDIEEKFDNLSKQLADVNNRIKLIEIKTELDGAKSQPTNSITTKNKTPIYSMEYIPTKAELDKSLQSDSTDTLKEKEKAKQVSEPETNSNKRPMPTSDQSSSDDKEKDTNLTPRKPRRKSIRLSRNEDNVDKDKDNEIANIKATQNSLEKGLLELKNMFQQFTIEWFNRQPNDGNSSASTSGHQ